MYLIIGGTTKSGTTSLYKYLTDHPKTTAAFTKETRYFLDKDYPLKRKNYEKHNENFIDLFEKKNNLKIEATPDYLHSYGTPKRIKEYLSDNYHIVFLLRNPTERIKSWYKFSKSRGMIEKKMTFENFINSQQKTYVENNCHQYQLVKEQGLYSKYIANFEKHIPKERILIYTLDELKKNPKKVVQEICRKTNIDPHFYDDYDFRIENKTTSRKRVKIYRAYNTALRIIRDKTSKYPIIKKTLLKPKRLIDRAVDKLTIENKKQDTEIQIPKYIIEQYRESWEEMLSKIKLDRDTK